MKNFATEEEANEWANHYLVGRPFKGHTVVKEGEGFAVYGLNKVGDKVSCMKYGREEYGTYVWSNKDLKPLDVPAIKKALQSQLTKNQGKLYSLKQERDKVFSEYEDSSLRVQELEQEVLEIKRFLRV